MVQIFKNTWWPRANWIGVGLRGTGGVSSIGASVAPVPVGMEILHGVTSRWQGGQYVVIVAPCGLVGCGIFDLAVCENFGFAVAMAHGTPAAPLVEPEDLLRARIDTVSQRARELGPDSLQ